MGQGAVERVRSGALRLPIATHYGFNRDAYRQGIGRLARLIFLLQVVLFHCRDRPHEMAPQIALPYEGLTRLDCRQRPRRQAAVADPVTIDTPAL